MEFYCLVWMAKTRGEAQNMELDKAPLRGRETHSNRGSFNEILAYGKKERGANNLRRGIHSFRKVVEECNLWDLGYVGQCYTWEQGRTASTCVQERLDC